MCFSPQRPAIFRHQNFKKCSDFELFHFRMCFSPQRRAFFRHQNFQKCSEDYSFSTFSHPNVLFATAACNFLTSELTKVVRTRHVLCIFTSERAFRHRCVHFFNIRTYKSGPDTSCFVYFHFRMYLSPQGRAFFRHQNFQKWSKHLMFGYIFTSKCAFRHKRRAIFDFSSELRPPHPPL